ncbi:hypothetical protein Cgig2_025308 [Carnegiea gigantea]|uniref:Uncharacterized protein n=1 Tax=Carnegiea gigantea TaxID=171969 RepID=A0A9Q1GQR1_9CARY|nr:hypothetical protein Cgig2_025308 [Carnegiea gigantea]
MTNTIIQHVFKQDKKAVEAMSSARPLPCFKYVPTTGCEPSYRHAPVVSHCHSEGMREAPYADRNGRSRGENRDRSVGAEALHNRHLSYGRLAKSITASTPYATLGSRSRSRPRALEGKPQDKAKVRTLEIDFLLVNVPTAYNIILGQPTLYKVKAVFAPYLLQLQFEADDGTIGMMQGDQWIARECYLVSIRPLVEQTTKRGPIGPLPPDKKPQPRPPPPAAEALAIHTMTSTEPEQPLPETADGMEQILAQKKKRMIVKMSLTS